MRLFLLFSTTPLYLIMNDGSFGVIPSQKSGEYGSVYDELHSLSPSLV